MLLLSASQISSYRESEDGGCPRKWAFKSIAHIETPTHPAAALGTEVDDEQLQPYLRDGRTFDFSKESGNIAASALAFLPKPQTHGLELQKHFVFHSAKSKALDFGYQGYIDLWMPTGGMPEIGSPCDVYPSVTDFKTTGNLKWQKTPEQLKTDVQGQLYATWATFEMKTDAVDLVWIYMQTKGARKAKRSYVRVERDHVARQFVGIESTAIEMVKVRRELEARTDKPIEELVLELPPNPNACDAFGGCPFRGRCNLSPAAFTEPHMESIDMSTTADLLAKLKAKRAGIVTGYELSQQQTDGQAAADKGVEIVTTPMPTNLSVVGINPPEKDLPVVVATAPIALVEPAVAIEKPKRGRPAGAKNAAKDPVSAEAAVHTDPFYAAIEKQVAIDSSRNERIGALVSELFTLLGAA